MHPETSSFHLPHSEITITFDDVTCLLRLPIRGTLLGHGRLTKEEAKKMLIAELGADPDDALEEVERTRGAHLRFYFLQLRYDDELLAAHEAVGDEVKADIHRERALICCFLYLIGTQLFVDMSLSYTDVVYLRLGYYNTSQTLLAWERCLPTLRSCRVPVHSSPSEGTRCRILTGTDLIAWPSRTSYTSYPDHRETVPFDKIALYYEWLAVSSTIIARYLPDRVIRQFGYQ
ncbi:uncharacterized protein LOC131605206 [Vicia villosa]|uniref:uncharacterized protein LOC131605206 n=1 Tax=Vicia villosa TaxID=3911 RepID=UPI00273A8EB6|nr:uncharacterized protein LOC131605206 [Vicia villosa]